MSIAAVLVANGVLEECHICGDPAIHFTIKRRTFLCDVCLRASDAYSAHSGDVDSPGGYIVSKEFGEAMVTLGSQGHKGTMRKLRQMDKDMGVFQKS